MRSILWMITKWWCIMFDIVMKDGHCWSDLMILLSWSHFTSGDRVYVCVETCKTLGSGCVLLPGRLNTITRWLDSKQCLGCTGLQCWQPSLKRDLYCLSLLAPPPPPHPTPYQKDSGTAGNVCLPSSPGVWASYWVLTFWGGSLGRRDQCKPVVLVDLNGGVPPGGM